jgi:hypothetical protein
MKAYIFNIADRVIVSTVHGTPEQIIDELITNHPVLRGITFDRESLVDNDDYENVYYDQE